MAGDVEGTPFGRYRLVSLLGRGGMGEVWRAYDPVNTRYVALKVLPASSADDEVFRERFRREARAAAGLDEPHVIPIHDSGEIDGRLFVSMRLVKGRDLQQLIADGPLSAARAVAIIEQVAFALHAAHQVGLVHRDVKPSNILVADNDFAYLIDFGIARAAGETGLTSTGLTIGTWAYMAPERFKKGGVADAPADIYALACVLYEALTGQPPFPTDAIEQIAVAHMLEPPPRPSQLHIGAPEAFDEVIARGMAKEPDQRYASTKDLAAAARGALHIPPPTSPSPPPPPAPAPAPAPGLATDHQHGATAPLTAPAQRSTPPPEPATVAFADASTRHAPLVGVPVPAPPPRSAPTAAPGPRHQRLGTRTKILAGLAIAVIAATALIAGVVNRHSSSTSPAAPTTALSAAPTTPRPAQTVLPFTGLDSPQGVAVDAGGAVFVTDLGNKRVLKLVGDTQTVLPFTGLDNPRGVAVDAVGAVYITDSGNKRVLKLAAGASSPTVLPFTSLEDPRGVAVDAGGAVYVADWGSERVLKLVGGTQTVLPFTGLSPGAVAVDAGGAVYVTANAINRVLKLAAGASTPTVLPFTGLKGPQGVAVDASGAVYLTDYTITVYDNDSNQRVLKLGGGTQTVLPFTGLDSPQGVAVDAGGNVYIADHRNGVLKLAP